MADEEEDWWPAPEGPESPRHRYNRILETGFNTERTVFFSDAVMAIAMTLLVLEIKIPDVPDAKFGAALLDDLGVFFSYAISFAIIGINWVSHHRKFKLVERYNSGLMWRNFLFLFFIAILPLATEAVGSSSSMIAISIYAIVISACQISQMLIWIYARRHKLLRPIVDRALFLHVIRSQLPLPIVFLLSIPIGLIWGADIARWSWFLMIPASIIVGLFDGPRSVPGERRLSPPRG
jgi:uncharacterized membrane protein